MERLWAPWRIDYILSEKSDECIFCEGAGTGNARKHLVVHRGEQCLVMMNRFPYNNGHVMVAPVRHVGRLEDLVDDESADLMRVLQLSITSCCRCWDSGSYSCSRCAALEW
jgi:ATP adenylyltransferase